jgi:hypothetical protein
VGFSTGDHQRNPRWVGSLAIAAAPTVLPKMWDAVKYLFVTGDTILKSLTSIRSKIPVSFRSLTDAPEYVSEIISVIQSGSNRSKQYEDDFNQVVQVMKELKDDASKASDWADIESSFHQTLIMEQSVLLQQLTYQTLTSSAMEDCRNHIIPLWVLPPSVLAQRLREVGSKLSKDYELVFPEGDLGYYYNLKFATCKFDDEGAVIGVKTLLRPSHSTYELNELKTFAFAWKNFTCDVGISSSLIVIDSSNSAVYPVTPLDEEECEMRQTTVCRLPYVSLYNHLLHYIFIYIFL